MLRISDFGPLRAPDDGGAGAGAGGEAGAAGAPAAGNTAGGNTTGEAGAASGAAVSLLGDAKGTDGAQGGAASDPANTEGGEPGSQKGAEGKNNPEAAPTPPDYSGLTLPEGLSADSPYLAALKEVGIENNLPPKVAQALIDKVGPQLKNALEAPYKAWVEQNEKWKAEIRADKAIGGAAFDKNRGLATAAIDAIAGKADTPGGKAFREALDATGAGNHPEVVRFFVRLGQSMSEGKLVTGGAAPVRKSPASVLYPDHPTQN
jgi:hypothetical protein